MRDSDRADVLSIHQDDRCDDRLVDRFPCILRQPQSASDLHAHVAREWIACVEWLTACTCDANQSAMIAMLRAAGEQIGAKMPWGSEAPITAKGARRAIYGETDQVPVYGMLVHLAAAAPDVRETLRPLASQLMLAYATLIYHDEGDRIDLCRSSNQGSRHPIPSAVSASRLVRQLAEGKHEELLTHLPHEQASFADVYVDIEARLSDPQARYVSAVRDFCVTIRDAQQIRPRRSKRGSSRTPAAEASQSPESGRSEASPGRERVEAPRSGSHRRQRKPVGGTRTLSISPLTADQARDHQRAGLAANEVRAKRATVQSDSLRGEPRGGSLSMRTRCQQGMVKDRARANQGLPIHRGVPRADEIRFLVEALERWSQGLENTNEAVDAEAVGLLGLMLATGGTVEELHDLPVVREESAIPDDQSRAILTRGGIHLWVRVPTPEMNPALYSEVSNLLQPIETGLLLTLPKPILTLLRSVRKIAGTLKTSSMFASNPEDLKEAATKRLRKINERHYSQLRLARIPSVLPQVIADQCGNWSYAWILSGDGDPHAHTPLVYQTTPKSRLVSAYRDAIDHIFCTAGEDDEADPSSATSDECYYGSALRPLPGVWDGIARELQEGIPEAPSPRARTEEHVTHHNAYTLYTSMLALVGTGLRAVRDPIESVLDIDWDNGLLFLVDKEARASGNERLIPLAPTVLQQLKAYRRHLLALASRWDHRQPEPAAELRAAAFGNEESIPFLVFLSQDMSAKPVRPGTLSPRLSNLFPAPVNLGRHHIRTHLTEMGCPGEWIDALLGHEPIGMEAYGPYSALSIHDMRCAAADWIEPMLQRHGWAKVEGVPT